MRSISSAISAIDIQSWKEKHKISNRISRTRYTLPTNIDIASIRRSINNVSSILCSRLIGRSTILFTPICFHKWISKRNYQNRSKTNNWSRSWVSASWNSDV